MPTRRQQAAAAKGMLADVGISSNQVQPVLSSAGPVGHSAKATPASTVNTFSEKGTESIGSRLCKRRRTDSFPTDDRSPAPKRPQPKKTIAPSGGRAQVAALPQDASSSSNVEPMPPQQTSSRFGGGMNQDDILADQLEQTTVLETTQPELAVNAQPHSGGESYGVEYNGIDGDINSHRGPVDSHYTSQGYDAMGTIDTESFHHLGANFHLKVQSLPVLDNLATQILSTLAKSTYREILTIATEPDSDPGQAYATLKSLFDHAKKVYSTHEPFLNSYQLGLVEHSHLNTMKKANVATFVSSVFGSQDVGFYHLNENFLDTFIADGSRLLKNQAQLFLDLKTQAYISAITSGDRSREEILEDLFPHDLTERLLKRRPGAKQLTPSEAEFVQRARNRRKALLEEPDTGEAVKALPEKYSWEDFLRDISTYVAKNFEAIAGVPARKSPRPARASESFTPDQKKQQQAQQTRGQRRTNQQRPSHQTPQTPQTQQDDHVMSMRPSNQPSSSNNNVLVGATDEFAQKAARAADFAMQDFGTSPDTILAQRPLQHSQPPAEGQAPGTAQNSQPQVTREIRYHFENELHPNVPAPPPPQYIQDLQFQASQQLQGQWDEQMGTNQIHQSYNNQHLIPNPAQSAPTQVLYERARQAATSKSSPSNRRSGTPSQRRPWSADEENSLMAGLDRVKGPHWSQILAMFGPGGTINEVLKDRNQVQLKDKARNLKLFFLKSGIEVPYYLQFVTGELKTRAPGQAAKNEAKEKGTSDEDRAHYEGVIALAGRSMQESDQLETSQNGVVPTANMGGRVTSNGRNGVDSAIDPNIDSNVEMAAIDDAAADGVGELMSPASQALLQQQQSPHGFAGTLQMNGTTINGTTGRAIQPISAQRTINSSSPNVDPALSV